MIKVDEIKKEIYWGDLYIQKRYIHDLDYKKIKSIIGTLNSEIRKMYDCKLYKNQDLFKILGVSPKKFASMLNAVQYKLWIKEDEKLIKKLCYVREGRKYKLNPGLIEKFHKNKAIINQYVSDGNIHLLAFGFNFNKNTKELKQMFPHAFWKSVNKNTFSRNKLIQDNIFYKGTSTNPPIY